MSRSDMWRRSIRVRGSTLVELLVTIVIAAILLALAVPSFADFRQRSIVRGAAGNLVAAVTQAKSESARRNNFITVSVQGSGASWCIGVQTGNVATGATECDCTASATATTCDVTQVPASENIGARLQSAANFNGVNYFVIDPRLGMLADTASAGTLTVLSSTTSPNYGLQFSLSATAQTKLCVPSSSKPITDYPNCP